MDSFSLYLVNPYNITRGLVTFGYTRAGGVLPGPTTARRVTSSRASRARMPFPFLRASTTTVLKDMLTDLIIGEMYRGTPIVYADYLGYDEVAHHAGPERPESLDELDHVDRILRTLVASVTGRAPRLPLHPAVGPRSVPGRHLR